MQSDYESEVINFPVPKQYYTVVVQALAKAMAADEPSVTARISTPSTGDTPSESRIDWTSPDNFKKLRRELRAPGAFTLLDLVAAREGQYVSYKEVVAEAGRDDARVRADLAALTKAIKRAFNVDKAKYVWPVSVKWAAGGEPQMYYKVKPEVANAWKASAEA